MTAPTPPECDPERVETVARAMHEVPGQPGVYGRIPWDRLMAQHRDAYRGMVRAAIAADPSPAAEAAHEVECPSCGTTIRARMADADSSPAEEAVKRVEAVLARAYPVVGSRVEGTTMVVKADHLRAALPAPAPQDGAR